MSTTHVLPSPAKVRPAILFDGFPYVVTQVVPGLHHLILLPRTLAQDEYLAVSWWQATSNRLPTCLVITGDYCLYFQGNGESHASAAVPRSEWIVSERLHHAVPMPITQELSIRRMRLVRIEESQHEGRGSLLMFGDLTKGGRHPTPEEESRLAGTHCDGVPKGLLPCLTCGEWRGECLDTLGTGLIVRVHCTCENDNRCARCGGHLSDRKLNANYFDPVDRTVWHVPGFSGLEHRCWAWEEFAPARLLPSPKRPRTV